MTAVLVSEQPVVICWPAASRESGKTISSCSNAQLQYKTPTRTPENKEGPQLKMRHKRLKHTFQGHQIHPHRRYLSQESPKIDKGLSWEDSLLKSHEAQSFP